MHKSRLAALCRSFGYAGKGLWYAICTQRNIRIHLVASVVVFYAAKYFHFTAARYGLLALCCGLVIGLELVNTAIETLVDELFPDFNKAAGTCKDLAAAAVLAAAVSSVAVALYLFCDPAGWAAMWYTVTGSVLHVSAILAALLLAVWFVFFLPNPSKNKK